ncbi:bifunctional 5,10-methylene-tetrahydrofolate dehydrogenase/5,10-methylene-tetrahydrofolate cyclohydrolase [Rhodococcus sp. RS1C4]|nr:bifunctional 5,10-methylenetetrahydrofolate dehydrogenase/5,10-methenyltetrahydrofolate cyclohydrolase [Rhodococcus sp. RS1C4]OZC51663.1 bifunctional 5,10-methylene-tetrahydrofolate dehydrogenase/5,10-methylene-tetrahydrofolate cyclohydrolase [Rhodococcus sp. RS1C4]
MKEQMLTARILDGRRSAEALLNEVRSSVFASDVTPCLATILVGDDPASHTYVRMKARRATDVGIESRRIELPTSTTTEELLDAIDSLNSDTDVHGILLQHPVPAHIDERQAFDAIAPGKDVDGVTSASFSAMALHGNGFRSCTPGGIIRLLQDNAIEVRGKHAVVVGRSAILGLPVGMLLLAENATVTYCHSHTEDLADRIAEADIVVAAVGRAELIRGDWIEPGTVVVDAGYNAGNVGDVEFDRASERAGWITPVPGGVGPMTIAVLLAQTVEAAAAQSILHLSNSQSPDANR